MTMRGPLLLLAASLLACESSPSGPIDAGFDAGAPATAVIDAGPVAPASPVDGFVARAAVSGKPGDWREAGDALARAGRKTEAVAAYDKCAEAAGDDFEMSLYCQAAAAVARKVKTKQP